MKVTTSNQSTEKIELKQDNNIENSCISPCDMPFKDIVNCSNNTLPTGTPSDMINIADSLLISSDLKAAFNYDTFSMDKDDAKFFIDMVNEGQFALNLQGNANAAIMNLSSAEETSSVMKSANVSKTLLNLVEEASKTNKPVRIDFDNNVSVILKVDKDGKLSANFIPGDKAVEQYLKNNIAFLKQRFDEQELPYNNLSYSQHRGQNKKRNNEGE